MVERVWSKGAICYFCIWFGLQRGNYETCLDAVGNEPGERKMLKLSGQIECPLGQSGRRWVRRMLHRGAGGDQWSLTG